MPLGVALCLGFIFCYLLLVVISPGSVASGCGFGLVFKNTYFAEGGVLFCGQ